MLNKKSTKNGQGAALGAFTILLKAEIIMFLLLIVRKLFGLLIPAFKSIVNAVVRATLPCAKHLSAPSLDTRFRLASLSKRTGLQLYCQRCPTWIALVEFCLVVVPQTADYRYKTKTKPKKSDPCREPLAIQVCTGYSCTRVCIVCRSDSSLLGGVTGNSATHRKIL